MRDDIDFFLKRNRSWLIWMLLIRQDITLKNAFEIEKGFATNVTFKSYCALSSLNRIITYATYKRSGTFVFDYFKDHAWFSNEEKRLISIFLSHWYYLGECVNSTNNDINLIRAKKISLNQYIQRLKFKKGKDYGFA